MDVGYDHLNIKGKNQSPKDQLSLNYSGESANSNTSFEEKVQTVALPVHSSSFGGHHGLPSWNSSFQENSAIVHGDDNITNIFESSTSSPKYTKTPREDNNLTSLAGIYLGLFLAKIQ